MKKYSVYSENTHNFVLGNTSKARNDKLILTDVRINPLHFVFPKSSTTRPISVSSSVFKELTGVLSKDAFVTPRKEFRTFLRIGTSDFLKK